MRMYYEGGGSHSTQGPPSYRVWGEGRARAPTLALHTIKCMQFLFLLFPYLRFAEAASFDKKELRRSYTHAVHFDITDIASDELLTCIMHLQYVFGPWKVLHIYLSLTLILEAI